MASRAFSLLWYLLVASSISGVCLGGALIEKGSPETEKVSLDLYYESLCPYSAEFIVNLLPSIFHNGLIDIVDLTLFPWGNAKLTPNNSFTCQHGPSECLLNTIEACAISVWPTLSEHFPFIYCVEKLVYERKYTQWEICFDELGLDPTPVTSCYSSGYGNELELKYAAITDALEPPHRYVPWVVVDGQPLYEDYENFTSYVCKAYKGPLPGACGDLSFDKALKAKTHQVHPVCYPEMTTKMPFLTGIGSSIRSWVLEMINRAML